MNQISAKRLNRGRQGFVLLAVLVFIFLLSMVTVSLLFRSRAEETGAHASTGTEQAWVAALSGIEEALQVAAMAVPGATEWADNPAAFRARLVTEDGVDRWYFTVFSPGDSDSLVALRYGLTDEAGKVNLNHPGATDLTKIPRMTPVLAQAIRRFVGDRKDVVATSHDPPVTPGSTVDEIGAAPLESMAAPGETGAASADGAHHGQLVTLDGLLQVPGFSWPLLHGEDANLNGRLDPNENDGDEHFPPDNKDGRLDHGMGQYFTVVAYDPNRTRSGQRRINLNDPNDPLPAIDLPAAFTNYITMLRAAKVPLHHPVEALESIVKIKNEQGQEVEVGSGITKEELPQLLELFTTDGQDHHEGLINLNTASATVLATLPGVDAALADSIVSARTSLSPDRRATIAWLYQDGIVDIGQFKTLAPKLTTGSFQFSFHVIGYGVPSGQYRVLDATIDVAGNETHIIRLRDITRLGLPFPLIGDGAEEPRSENLSSGP